MFKHILVPTDGSPHSARAARLAIRMARSSGARITAMHVVPPFVAAAYPLDGIAPYPELYSPDEYKRITHARAAGMLARIERSAAAAKVRCGTAIVDAEKEWKAIIAAARSRRCDLIVMGTHGRRGPSRWWLGSVAERVVREAPMPVLVVKAPSEEADAQVA